MTSDCATVAAGDVGGVTEIATGSLRNASPRRRISGAIVAEKNSVWRCFGKRPTMRSTSGMKPISSIRSASSMTRMRTSERRTLPRSKRSSSRPGVAINTSTPRSSFFSWSAKLSPPINSAVVTQASAAIPAVPLYLGLLRRVMAQKGLWEQPVDQMGTEKPRSPRY